MSQIVSSSNSSDELERLRAQLGRSEARLVEAQRIAQVGSWEWDIEVDAAWWSPEMRRIFGLAPDEPPLTYAAFLSRLGPVEAERVRHAIQAAIGSAVPFDIEYRIVHADGTPRVIHARGEVRTRSNGVATRMAGTVQDITARVLLEQALFESEARCRSIFERVPLGIVVVGPDKHFSMANSAWMHMTGYGAEDLAQMTWLELTHPDDLAKSLCIEASADAGNLDEFLLDKRYVRKDGKVFWARVIGAVLRDPQRAITGAVTIIEDISDEREAELRRAERQRLRKRPVNTVLPW